MAAELCNVCFGAGVDKLTIGVGTNAANAAAARAQFNIFMGMCSAVTNGVASVKFDVYGTVQYVFLRVAPMQ